MKKSIFIIFLFLFLICPLFGQGRFPQIQKTRHMLTFEVKTYQISTTESIVLYGAKERKFFTSNWYWGEAGYGAIYGQRSGYLEGGLILGYFQQLTPDFTYDLRLFTGAGGGGSAPQGGGFIVAPTIGLGYQMASNLNVCVELGYMHFVNGDISSPSLGLNFNMNFWALSYQPHSTLNVER
jgi:hypothetical protein